MDAWTLGDLTLRWHGHATVSLSRPQQRIYIDPYQLHGRWPDASHVLVTHSHYDHLDETSIRHIVDEDTRLIVPDTVSTTELPVPAQQITRLRPGEGISLNATSVNVRSVPAYTPQKRFHPQEEQWLGYVVETSAATVYHAGDTGPIPIDFDTDVHLALVPVDGIYTMTAGQAAGWIDDLDVKQAAPIHYGSERGSVTDALTFRRSLGQTEPVHLEQTRLTV